MPDIVRESLVHLMGPWFQPHGLVEHPPQFVAGVPGPDRDLDVDLVFGGRQGFRKPSAVRRRRLQPRQKECDRGEMNPRVAGLPTI